VALLALAGELYFRMDNKERARDFFEKALEADPDNYSANIGLGYVLYEQGQFPAAAQRFGVAAGKHPLAADAHYALGLAAMRLCERDTARRAFEAYLKLAPNTRYSAKAKEYLDNPEVF
jgi:tetratricopeptide (TPR) repeat protein